MNNLQPHFSFVHDNVPSLQLQLLHSTLYDCPCWMCFFPTAQDFCFTAQTVFVASAEVKSFATIEYGVDQAPSAPHDNRKEVIELRVSGCKLYPVLHATRW